MKRLKLILTLLITLTSQMGLTNDVPNQLRLDGFLTDLAGTPINASIDFKVRVYDESGTCLVYYEEHNAYAVSDGEFALSLGNGTSPAIYLVSSPTFENVFNNSSAANGAGCGGSQNFTANEKRQVTIEVYDGANTDILAGPTIHSVPYALYANTAEKVSGTVDIAQVESVAGSYMTYEPAGTPCGTGQILVLNVSGQWVCGNLPTGDITDVTAGAGLTGGAASGNAALAIGAGNGITVNADDVAVRLKANSGLAFDAGELEVNAGTGLKFTVGVLEVDISTDGTLVSNSDTKIPSEKAIKTYVDAQIAGAAESDPKVGTLSDNKVPVWNTVGTELEDSAITDNGTTVSVSSQLSLASGTSVNEFSTDGTLAGNSDAAVPTEKAVKTYVDAQVAASSDNLGDHTATEALKMGAFRVNSDGGATDGILYNADGSITLMAGASVNEFSTDGTLAGDSDAAVPTEKAIKTYVDAQVAAAGDDLGDHSATAILGMGGFRITNDKTAGDGILVNADGTVTLMSGASINEFSTDGTLAGDSDTAVPTEKAVKLYVDTEVAAAAGDNLGTHTATANLAMSNFDITMGSGDIALGTGYLSGDGDDEGVFVDGIGNVGIGTASPAANLHVAGIFRYVDGNQAAGKVLTSDLNGNATWGAAGAADNLGNHTATATIQLNDQWLSNDGGPEGIRVSNAGNVAIGHSSPSSIFHIRKDVNAQVVALVENRGTGAATTAQVDVSNEYGGTWKGISLVSHGSSHATNGVWVADSASVYSWAGSSAGLSVGTEANAPIKFFTNGPLNERMSISQAGLVKINNLSATRVVGTSASNELTSSFASAAMANSLTDETGTGLLVFNNSPSFVTALNTSSTTFGLIDSTATTVNFAGAATTINVGSSAAGVFNIKNPSLTLSTNNASINFTGTGTKTIVSGGNNNLSLSTGTGAVEISTLAAADRGAIHFRELAANGIEYVGFRAPSSLTGNTVYELPSAFPASDMVLQSSNTGVLTWVSPSGGGWTGTATSALDMNTFDINFTTGNIVMGTGDIVLGTTNYITGDGGPEGITINGDGRLSIYSMTDDKLAIGAASFIRTTALTGMYIGQSAGNLASTAINNVGIGPNSLDANTTGSFNTTVGSNTLTANTTGGNNSAFGYYSLASNTVGTDNSAFGAQSLDLNTTGSRNSAFGESSMTENTDGLDNSAFGYQALSANTSGDFNVAVGVQSLNMNTTGESNTALGSMALQFNQTAHDNTAVGQSALRANTVGGNNTAIGRLSLRSNTTGGFSVAVGSSALDQNVDSDENVAIGAYSQFSGTVGSQNTSIGYGSLYQTDGTENTAIGFNSGINLETGTGNIFIGPNAGPSSAGDFSDRLYISNQQDNFPLIYGEFDNDLVKINGTLQVCDANGAGCAAVGVGGDNLGSHYANQPLKMEGFTIFGNDTSGGDLTLESTSDPTKGNIIINPNPSAGNVGIGTITPSGKLHVVSGSPEVAGFESSGTSAGIKIIALSNDVAMGIEPGGDFFLDYQDDSTMELKISSSNHLVFHAPEGSPSLTTDENVSFYTVNTDDELWAMAQDSGGQTIDVLVGGLANRQVVGPPTALNDGETLVWDEGSGFWQYAPAGADDLGDHTANQALKMNNHWISGDGDSEGIYILSNGLVGIGNNTPASTLDVLGSSSAGTIRISDNNSNSNPKASSIVSSHFTNVEQPVTIISANMSGANNLVRIGGGSGTQNAATRISFFTGVNTTTITGSEKMTIDSAGNVGIGTSSPTNTLHVLGSLRIVDGSQGGGKILTSDSDGVASWQFPTTPGSATIGGAPGSISLGQTVLLRLQGYSNSGPHNITLNDLIDGKTYSVILESDTTSTNFNLSSAGKTFIGNGNTVFTTMSGQKALVTLRVFGNDIHTVIEWVGN